MKFTIKQARQYAGKTQAECAEHLKVHLNTYINKETGKSEWLWVEAHKLAELFGMEIT